jgi:hypothetical protein
MRLRDMDRASVANPQHQPVGSHGRRVFYDSGIDNEGHHIHFPRQRHRSMVRALVLCGPHLFRLPQALQHGPHMSKPQQAIVQRGLNIRQAASYWGVSPGTFRKLVRVGFAPEPLNLPGLDRNIYDKQALDDAMSKLAGRGG